MIRVLAVPIILLSMCVTIPQVEATCTTAKIGNQSFTNCSNGVTGFSLQSGPNSFHQFSDGSTSVTNSFGNTSFSNSNQPNLRGTSQSLNKETGVSQWNNGVVGVHQRVGNVQVDSYSDGTTCTTQTVGTTSLTTCNGKSKDAAKRSSIIGTAAGATDREQPSRLFNRRSNERSVIRHLPAACC